MITNDKIYNHTIEYIRFLVHKRSKLTKNSYIRPSSRLPPDIYLRSYFRSRACFADLQQIAEFIELLKQIKKGTLQTYLNLVFQLKHKKIYNITPLNIHDYYYDFQKIATYRLEEIDKTISTQFLKL